MMSINQINCFYSSLHYVPGVTGGSLRLEMVHIPGLNVDIQYTLYGAGASATRGVYTFNSRTNIPHDLYLSNGPTSGDISLYIQVLTAEAVQVSLLLTRRNSVSFAYLRCI